MIWQEMKREGKDGRHAALRPLLATRGQRDTVLMSDGRGDVTDSDLICGTVTSPCSHIQVSFISITVL